MRSEYDYLKDVLFLKSLCVWVVWGVGRGAGLGSQEVEIHVKVRGLPWVLVLETGSVLVAAQGWVTWELLGIFPLCFLSCLRSSGVTGVCHHVHLYMSSPSPVCEF